jgi:Tfp pilus assembly protein PilF
LNVIELDATTTPESIRGQLSEARIASLRKAVESEPGRREARFELVTALQRVGHLDEALREARRWREVDAYNLVVVRLIGDLLSEQGKPEEALRVYSAVVELLAEDPDAQRALATVLKQSGQLGAARQRLLAAHRSRPEDSRIAFELADASARLGEHAEARRLLTQITSDERTPHKIAYPAKQRLGQLLAAERRDAKALGQSAREAELTTAIDALKIKGGVDNDIKIYLTWDTNRTDVDLWVITPSGEKIFYSHKHGKHGGALFDDVTDGYGPESFTAKSARAGTYEVKVNFFGTSRRSFREARGEVTIIVGEGSVHERRHVVPYRLLNPKQTVTVAKIQVGSRSGGAS